MQRFMLTGAVAGFLALGAVIGQSCEPVQADWGEAQEGLAEAMPSVNALLSAIRDLLRDPYVGYERGATTGAFSYSKRVKFPGDAKYVCIQVMSESGLLVATADFGPSGGTTFTVRSFSGGAAPGPGSPSPEIWKNKDEMGEEFSVLGATVGTAIHMTFWRRRP